jgi:DNA-directed RNA polymerase specialized sigma24 family protein
MSRDHPSVLRYANSFARTTNLELDDLLQVGRMAHARAETAIDTGQYDPRKSSFNTFTTRVVYRELCSELEWSRRHSGPPTVSLDAEDEEEDGPRRGVGELADETTPAPDRRLVLAELIRELPEDARAVVDLVLGDLPDGLVDAVLDGVRGAPQRLRSYVRRTLGLRRGDRAEAAFSAIAEMLASI